LNSRPTWVTLARPCLQKKKKKYIYIYIYTHVYLFQNTLSFLNLDPLWEIIQLKTMITHTVEKGGGDFTTCFSISDARALG
jgi:hypothetical protein